MISPSYLLATDPTIQQITNTPTSTATMVEPTGVPERIDMIIPKNAHITERTAEQIVTALKFLNILMDDKAGNITNADISNDPTRFMARTIITAMTMAINRL